MQHRSLPTNLLRRAKACLSALVLAATGALAHTPPDRPHNGHADGLDELLHAYEQRIHFTENRGQFNPGVMFRADFPLGQALATPEGMLVKAYDPEAVAAREAEGHRIEEEARQGLPNRPLVWRERGHGWMMHFRGALPTMRIEGLKPHGDAANYFLGDASRHATGVSSFEEIWYKDVYPRTDVRYYAAEDGALEYDIICKPGSDPADIQLELRGIEKLRVTDKGELVVPTSLGDMLFPAPVVYQGGEHGEQRVDAAYTVQGNVVRFTLGAYDRTRPLVIDPIALRWATWVNTNSSGDNHGHGIWVDPNDGAIYVLARVVGTTDNITVGAFDETANGNLEIIVGKYLEPATVGGAGTRVWQTYIGGGQDDNPYAIEQGPDGNLYITGLTGSTNFPLLGGTGFSGTSIDQQAQSGDDIFVLKINQAGTGIKACVVGGNGGELSYDLRTTANGDVLVCGATTSNNLLTTNPGSGATNSNAGSNDALVFRVNADLSSMVWMRNSGGSGSDVATIMLNDDSTGDIFVGGSTASTNFPTVSPRQATRGGNSAGFLQRLSSTGAVSWSSYFSSASSAAASVLCMEFNTTRTELYFGGVTTGLAAANISGSGVFDSSHNGSNDFYVCRMGIDQTFLGATYLGGSGNEVNMMGLNVDQNNDVYVFGYSNSTNFPISASPNVPLQTTNQGSNDKTFSKLENDLSALLFSTYYGGAADDYDPVGERGIKFSNCRIYTIVTARSNNIPLTQGAINTTKNSSTSRYEPGLVVWANPPDLLGNSITYQGVAICPGSTPGDITGSEPSYVLPTILRNNAPSPYPSFGSAATYQWQISADSLTWTDIAGATGQDLPGSLIGAITADTYIRRIIGGDACILAGAADQVVKVRIMTASGTVSDASCNGGNDGSVTATADGQAPFTFAWSNGQTGATAINLGAGPISVTVTDANGCSATANFVVGQPAPLSATINTTLDACNNGTGGATASGTGGTPGYGYVWSTGAVGPVLSNVPAGPYSVTVTDLNQCSVTLPVNISGTMPPTALAGSDAEINCTTGATVQLNGGSIPSGLNFAWTGPGIVSGAGSATPTVNQQGTYVLTVTDPQTGCTGTDQVDVTVNTTPPGAQAAGGTLTCTTTCVTLQGSGNGSYSWTGPNNFSSTDQNPTVCAAGTYTLVVTGANGCTSTATADVLEDVDVPGAQAAGGTLTCTTTCITLQGSGNGSYSWTGPNNFSSNDQNPTVCAAGTYTLVVTGANGCTSTATAEVELDNDVPGAQAAGGTLTCTTTCITLQGSGNGSYSWTGPNNFSSNDQNPTVCAAGTYTLVVTGANGCTSTATADVLEDVDVPGAQAAGGTLTCTTTCITLQGSGNGSYSWTGPNNFSSTDQNPTVCAAGTYTLVVTGANGCTSTATAEVELDNDVPGAQAAGGTLTCTTTCITLQGSGNGSYSWTGPNNFSSTDQNPTVCAAGTYTLVVTGANGCTSTATAEVELDNDVPGAQAAGGTLTCTTTCITLQGSGNGSYSWTGPNNFSSTDQNPTVCAAGTYTLVVTGANGCTSTATADVLEDVDVPGAQAAGGTLTCTTTCVTLQGSGNGSYSWTGPNNFSSTDQNPTVCAAGTYTLVVTGANGCTSTATADVLEDVDVPGAQAAGGTLTCTTTCITLQGSGNGSYSWTGPNNFSSNDQNPTVCAAGTYTLVVTGANGCTSTATAEVELDNDVPGAQAAGGTLTCTTTCITLQGSGNGSYSWTGPNNFSSNDQNPTVCAAGTYTLVVTGANGCTSTATAEVELDSDVPGAQAAGGTLTCTTTCITLQGSGNGSYSWTGPNNFSSTDQNPTVCAAGTYTLVVTGANGCTSTATAEVELDNDVPGAQAAGGTLTCTTTCITLQGSGNGSYSWTGPNNFSSTDQNPTVCAAGTYTLVVTGANGCTSTATADVLEDVDVPGAQAAGGTLTCTTTCITLQGSGNGSYSWTGPNNFSSNDQNPTVCAAGTYTLVVTGANGCTSTATADVLEDVDVPGAQAAGGTLTCTTTCITLQGSGNGSYSWTGPNNFSSTDQNPTVCAAGTYTLVVTGANGCTSTATADVLEDVDVPGAQAAGGTLTCTTTCVTLQGSGNGSYSWTGPNNFSSNDQNPTVCAAGTYTLVVTGANGCTSTATADVLEDVDVPGAQAVGGTLTCTTTCITLQGSGNGSYSWTGPNNFSSTDQNPTVCAAGTYTLVVTGANGCTSTATAEVLEESTAPDLSAEATPIDCITGESTLTAISQAAVSFAWTGPNGFTSSAAITSTVEAGSYTVTVTGANGCATSMEVLVIDDCDTDECGKLIEMCGPDVTVECGSSLHPYDVGHPIFRKDDKCPEVTVGWTDSWSGSCPYVLTRTWWATDANGNSETCVQTITVVDTQGPELLGVPADITVACDELSEVLPEVHAVDACKNASQVIMTEVFVPGNCPGNFQLVRTWSATDDCGNSTSATQTVTVVDNEAPVLVGVPADLTVQCDEKLPEAPVVTAEDACSANLDVVLTEQTIKGDCKNEFTLIRTWTVSDLCGNTTTAEQVIDVVDTTPPTILCTVADLETTCDQVPDPEACKASDNCDEDVQVVFTEDMTGKDCEKGYTITRTWTAVDDCGNASELVQVITVKGVDGKSLSITASPNPFRVMTTLRFTADRDGQAVLDLTDLQGRPVARLFDGHVQRHAEYQVELAADGLTGTTYFYHLMLDGRSVRGRLVLTR